MIHLNIILKSPENFVWTFEVNFHIKFQHSLLFFAVVTCQIHGDIIDFTIMKDGRQFEALKRIRVGYKENITRIKSQNNLLLGVSTQTSNHTIH
jgi:hypothetical protein